MKLSRNPRENSLPFAVPSNKSGEESRMAKSFACFPPVSRARRRMHSAARMRATKQKRAFRRFAAPFIHDATATLLYAKPTLCFIRRARDAPILAALHRQTMRPSIYRMKTRMRR